MPLGAGNCCASWGIVPMSPVPDISLPATIEDADAIFGGWRLMMSSEPLRVPIRAEWATVLRLERRTRACPAMRCPGQRI